MRMKKVKSYTWFKYILLFFWYKIMVLYINSIGKTIWSDYQYYSILKCTSAIYIVYREIKFNSCIRLYIIEHSKVVYHSFLFTILKILAINLVRLIKFSLFYKCCI